MSEDGEDLPYLSPRWLAAADRAAASIEQDPETALTVHITVTGTPEFGDVDYQLVVDSGRLRIRPGPPDQPTGGSGSNPRWPSLTMSYPAAAAIAQGRISAQRAFLDGEIRLGGDLNGLLDTNTIKALAGANDCFGQLRDRTVFLEPSAETDA